LRVSSGAFRLFDVIALIMFPPRCFEVWPIFHFGENYFGGQPRAGII
jgi:hypothetical protein